MTKFGKFQSWLRAGLQHFCDHTQVHGFHELYYAKNCFWFIFWFIICFGSCVVTVYQISNTTAKYMNSSTVTEIVPAQEENIQYPTFSLCLFHWYYWVDWNKALSLNISKQALLYGFSYYNYIFYSSKFDVGRAKKEFELMMMAKNFNTLSEFYFYVSRDVPIVNEVGSVKQYFNKKQILFNVYFNMFCYQIDADNMKRMFNRSHNVGSILQPKILQFDVADDTYKDYKQLITIEEHKEYVKLWMGRFTLYQFDVDNPNSSKENFSTFTAPKIVVISGSIVKGTRIQPDSDAYFFSVRASAYVWQNTIEKPCNETKKALSSDMSCQNLCELDKQTNSCTCLTFEVATRRNRDTMGNVCQRGFYFATVINDTVTNTSLSLDGQDCRNDVDVLNQFYKCTNNCLAACEIWTYDESLSITQTSPVLRNVGKKTSTTVRIEFPMGKDCIVMSDTEAQSWESYVGNVGGLLGIWTGASVISFIQFCYLCCCTTKGEFWSCSCMYKKKHKVTQSIGPQATAPQSRNVPSIG